MTEPVSVLLVFVNEADLWFDRPLYEAIVTRLHDLGVAGATAHAGLIGFGHRHVMHEKGVFGMAADRPVTITVVDTERNIQNVLPEIRALVQQGLVVLMRGELIHLHSDASEG
jgi:PII-like signaling protein